MTFYFPIRQTTPPEFSDLEFARTQATLTLHPGTYSRRISGSAALTRAKLLLHTMRTSHSIAAALSTGLGLASAACSASSFLYVTTYPTGEGSVGKVATFSLGESGLESVAASDDCGPYPSWLTQAGDVLYCVDEAWPSPNGSLTSLQVGEDGLVSKLSSLPTFGGPVSTIIYGDGGRGLAVAD